MKKLTVSKLKNKLWPIYSLFIRTRDCLRTTGCTSWGLCISCGKRYHIKLLQAGHFIPGRHNANLYYDRGCHAQCYNCNVNLKGNTLAYMDALIRTYGEGIIAELRANDNQMKQFTVPELLEKIELTKSKLQELEAGCSLSTSG